MCVCAVLCVSVCLKKKAYSESAFLENHHQIGQEDEVKDSREGSNTGIFHVGRKGLGLFLVLVESHGAAVEVFLKIIINCIQVGRLGCNLRDTLASKRVESFGFVVVEIYCVTKDSDQRDLLRSYVTRQFVHTLTPTGKHNDVK